MVRSRTAASGGAQQNDIPQRQQVPTHRQDGAMAAAGSPSFCVRYAGGDFIPIDLAPSMTKGDQGGRRLQLSWASLQADLLAKDSVLTHHTGGESRAGPDGGCTASTAERGTLCRASSTR